jgi:ferritin-like metal-binding protein YciE
MPVNSPREVFVHLLSDLRQNSERSAKFYQEISQVAQQPEIKEALEARAFVSNKTLATLDQCFKLIGEQPVKLSGRIQEVFVAAADMTGHYAVGLLLESCLADRLAFVKRTKRLIRNLIETKVTEKIASKAA